MAMHARAERLPAQTSFRDPFPASWAGAWGEDECGLWMTLLFRDARQTFRWIEPGTFAMGSPKDEPERRDDETPHEVTLTRGFWLAESACTQALWQAVTGENPSRFQGDARCPVENVSWNAVQRFLKLLNQAVPELHARLPTEAEWEYACRAGTTTPFSFGANITPEIVNYDGNSSYAGGPTGLYRKRTVPVNSLLPNPWGLFEMHGNVWEWCADWYGPYAADTPVDPQGARSGTLRVFRGGSWLHNARNARSACRSHARPDRRFDHVGCRLALG